MPVLFISRGSMSGACQVVECLGKNTGIRCISRESLVKRAMRHSETARRLLQELNGAISHYERFSALRWRYLVLLRHALLEEIVEDNVVYHGYSAHFLLPVLQHFIRVRIDAPIEFRIRMTMERLKCDEEKAGSIIKTDDEQRVKWARFMYCRDIRDPRFYDLHLNLGHMSLKAVCGLLTQSFSEQEFQANPQTREEVKKLLLEATVQAALVSDARLSECEISAKLEDGCMNLYGPYLGAVRATAIDVAKKAACTADVFYKPGYSPWLDTFS